jgi:hypothetical protein
VVEWERCESRRARRGAERTENCEGRKERQRKGPKERREREDSTADVDDGEEAVLLQLVLMRRSSYYSAVRKRTVML